MHITIKGIVGSKEIKLPVPIDNSQGLKKIAIVEILTDSVFYENKHALTSGKRVLNKGRHSSREVIEKGLKDSRDIDRFDGLTGITELKFKLRELDGIENLVDGIPSDELMTYHVSASSHKMDLMRFEPRRLRYKEMKKETIDTISIKITDQKDKIVREGLVSTVILHIE